MPVGSSGKIELYKVRDVSECDEEFFNCDNTTCWNQTISSSSGNKYKTNFVCTSHCNESEYCLTEAAFICSDGNLIFKDLFCDGFKDCNDGSDEIKQTAGFKCDGCILPQSNVYDNVAQCNDSLDLCDNKSNNCFHCLDESFIISSSQFCDGVIDCEDESDECDCPDKNISCFQCVDKRLEINKTRFCDGSYDCNDLSDECGCIGGNAICFQCLDQDRKIISSETSNECVLCHHNNNSCFECLDKKLQISPNHICDGRNDCYDSSDECLCDNRIETEICVELFETKQNELKCFENEEFNYIHSSLKIKIENPKANVNSNSTRQTCVTKADNFTQAVFCDGRPECKDYSDECECDDPPRFCKDACHSIFPMGDRYCDGIEDSAFIYINNPDDCPQGFDELRCPKRFRCPANGKVSIDLLQVCNGNPDCDDGSDEENCDVFASATEMIESAPLGGIIWIMGIFVTLGNVYVIISSALLLRKKKNIDSIGFQHMIILNISIADFIMGVYLLTIAAYSLTFSGIYGDKDSGWKSGLKCSIIGSLSVISSETSCFLMVILTAFRLVHVYLPFKSMMASLRPWKLSIFAAWLLSFLLCIIPILPITSSYFTHTISFPSIFHSDGTITVAEFKQFMCNYALLRNITIDNSHKNELKSILNFLKNYFPESKPITMFGYYGETSVCMPRFYVARGDQSWEYTITIITLNFLCFIFNPASYFFIHKRSQNSCAKVRVSRSDKQAARMRRRITRIIATDFCCWIPICIMVFIRLHVEIPGIIYQISAVLLLPINSALNPFLFSSLPDKLFKWCCLSCLNNRINHLKKV